MMWTSPEVTTIIKNLLMYNLMMDKLTKKTEVVIIIIIEINVNTMSIEEAESMIEEESPGTERQADQTPCGRRNKNCKNISRIASKYRSYKYLTQYYKQSIIP